MADSGATLTVADTMPKSFVLVGARRAATAGDAREGSRHLARHLVARVRRARQGGRHAPARDRPPAAATSSRSWPTPCRNGSTPTWASCAPAASHRASIRPTRPSRSSTSSTTAAPRVLFVENDEQLDKIARGARALPDARARSSSSTWRACPTSAIRWSMSLDELHGARPRVRPGQATALWEELVGLAQPEDLAILVYTSGTTGPPKGAMLSHRNVIFQMRNCMHPELSLRWHEDDEQLAFLPLCHVAERTFAGFYYSLALRRHRQLRREPRDGAGQHPRGAADAFLRRAAHLGEVLFRHHHPHEGGDAAASSWAYKRAIGVGLRRSPTPGSTGASPPSLGSWRMPGRRLAGAATTSARLIGIAPLPLAGHRRRADRARPDPLVPGARRRHVRGLRPDRELRPGDRHAADRIKLGTVGVACPYGEVKISPEGEILLKGRTSSWAT